MNIRRIQSPDDASLLELCTELARLAPELDERGAWPEKQLELCGRAGVFEWFVPLEAGGQGWSEADVVRGYLALGQACLTTTFVITQRAGACSRIAVSENTWPKEMLLPDLLSGRSFATVGISHLTTSRQHMAPVLRAEETEGGFVFDGYSPWVTGGEFAQHIVVGATLADGRQILVALPTDLPGVTVPPSPELVALSASHTGPVNCQRVFVDRQWLLAGPVQDVMKQGLGAKTGGLQTSTLAVGLTRAAVDFLERQAQQRTDLAEPARAFRDELNYLEHALLALAGGEQCGGWSAGEVRTQANSLVLRATQAALAAAKGAGFIASHAVGRWCREALFFLVWSCPQGVLAANLCEFAGLEHDGQ
jgi:alkylation response protein AidB-like acyl-CoA dehydrogenase